MLVPILKAIGAEDQSGLARETTGGSTPSSLSGCLTGSSTSRAVSRPRSRNSSISPRSLSGGTTGNESFSTPGSVSRPGSSSSRISTPSSGDQESKSVHVCMNQNCCQASTNILTNGAVTPV